MKYIFSWLENVINIAVITMLAAIGISINLQIVTRSVFGKALTWPEEISQFLLITVVFLGACLVEKKDSQINVDLFYTKFPKLTRPITVFGRLLTTIYVGALLISEIQLFPSVLMLKSKAAQIPIYIIHLVMIVGILCWISILVFKVIRPSIVSKEESQC